MCSDHDVPSGHLHALHACRHAAQSRSWTSRHLSPLIFSELQSHLAHLDLRTITFDISGGEYRRRIARLEEGCGLSWAFAAIRRLSICERAIRRT